MDDIEELILEVSEDNENLFYILLSLKDEERIYLNLLTCKNLGITGDRLYKLYSLCSNYNYYKLIDTIMMFRFGIYSKEEIDENLDKNDPIEFIDDSIKYETSPNGSHSFKIYAYRQKINYLFKRDLSNQSIIKKHF